MLHYNTIISMTVCLASCHTPEAKHIMKQKIYCKMSMKDFVNFLKYTIIGFFITAFLMILYFEAYPNIKVYKIMNAIYIASEMLKFFYSQNYLKEKSSLVNEEKNIIENIRLSAVLLPLTMVWTAYFDNNIGLQIIVLVAMYALSTANTFYNIQKFKSLNK